jgi:DNA-binding PadR family transcriptional regulator
VSSSQTGDGRTADRPRRAGRRAVGNPLALAVLAILADRPTHPYEVGRLLRERRKESSIKLNYGSLYMVVEQLARAGFITARETEREGNLPERTVYALTDAGRRELRDWMRDLLGTWRKEYRQFESALALIYVLPPGEAVALLRQRRAQLDTEIEREAAEYDDARARGVARLFLIEAEYRLALLRAERGCVESQVSLIEDNDPRIDRWWRELHLRREE